MSIAGKTRCEVQAAAGRQDSQLVAEHDHSAAAPQRVCIITGKASHQARGQQGGSEQEEAAAPQMQWCMQFASGGRGHKLALKAPHL